MASESTQSFLIAASVCGRRRDSKIVVIGETLASTVVGLVCDRFCDDLNATGRFKRRISWLRHGWDGGIVRMESVPARRFKVIVRAVHADVTDERVFKKLSLTIKTMLVPDFCEELVGMCREAAG